MLNDNKINLILIKNHENQNQIKHNNIIHHYIRGLIEEEKLAIE